MERPSQIFSIGSEQSVYTEKRGLILAFHGTDEEIVRDVVLQTRELTPSMNLWDWIGHGIYFWEQSPARALEFAISSSHRKNSRIKRPAVLGAVLDLGYCLDLIDYENFQMVKDAYVYTQLQGGSTTLRNKSLTGDDNFLVRYLDCAVIEAVHDINKLQNQPPFDSVRAAFWEGPLLYPTAGFREKNHIQICIRNPNCIKGLFIPRKHADFKN